MLQRAASNAYSWWWASHIRTKQSKWMEQNLQDMEEKVQIVLKLIQEDGDSFAKRAEMYYKKRPELISFVEESYRAYRSLAERYDHISTELQNANNTIASLCPDQVPFMDEDDEDAPPRPTRKLAEGFKTNIPKPPIKDLKSVITATTATRKLQPKKTATTTAAPKVPKSGLSRKEAIAEINKLQKQILTLQTVKEFVKSTYDNAIAKYWETEEQIKELQERVSSLQDELGEGIVIEDDEARRLMAEAALKSCQETLLQLQEKQERSLDETRIESKRIKDVRAKLGSLMNEFHCDQSNSKEPRAKRDVKQVAETKDLDKHVERLTQQRQELQLLQENLKEKFEAGSNSSLSVTEMAEKINELVNKVISLETAVSSQTALVNRLRTETDELQDQIRTLEEDKESLIKDKTKLNSQLREMEGKLHGVQDLNQIVEDQNSNLQTHFTEARCNLDHLSEKVQNVQPDEKVEVTDLSQTKGNSSGEAESKYELEGQVPLNQDSVLLNDVNSDKELKVTSLVDEKVKVTDLSETKGNSSGEAESKYEPEGQVPLNQDNVILNDVKSDNELKVTSLVDEKVKVTDLSETKGNSSGEAESKYEPEGQVPLNQDNVLLNNVKSDKELKVTSLVEDAVNSDKELKVADAIENDVMSDNKLKVIGSPENGVQAENELRVTGSLENDVKSENEVKVTGSLEMEEATPVEKKSPTELKEQEKTVNPGHSITVPLSTPTGNQEVSQHPASNKAESSGKQQGNDATQISSETSNALKVDYQEQATAQDEPDWRQLFMNGMQDREQVLLTEYTNILRNYKDVKKKLNDLEKKNQDSHFDSSLQLKELKTANALKDEEIRLLRKKLGLLRRSLERKEDSEESSVLPPEKDDIEELLKIEEPESTSAIEEKFRLNIDEILEENLDFWLKFSTSFTEIQKFETTIKDLLSEASKLEEKGKSSEGSSSIKYSIKSDARPIYKHLTEIQTELAVWMEQSALLKEELQRRFSSLCDIQEEITAALKASAEDDDFKFTSYQAAKFQGEVLNMKQENNKVADELQAGLDAVTTLQIEVDKSLAKLNEQFGFSTSKRQQNGQLRNSENRARVPLRSFIFGVKPKKQKQSIFSCMTPGMQRKYRALR